MLRAARAEFTGAVEGERVRGQCQPGVGWEQQWQRQRQRQGKQKGALCPSRPAPPPPAWEQPRCFRCPCSHCPPPPLPHPPLLPPPPSRSPEKTLGWRSPPPPGQAGRGSPSSHWLLTGPKVSQTVPEEGMEGGGQLLVQAHQKWALQPAEEKHSPPSWISPRHRAGMAALPYGEGGNQLLPHGSEEEDLRITPPLPRCNVP